MDKRNKIPINNSSESMKNSIDYSEHPDNTESYPQDSMSLINNFMKMSVYLENEKKSKSLLENKLSNLEAKYHDLLFILDEKEKKLTCLGEKQKSSEEEVKKLIFKLTKIEKDHLFKIYLLNENIEKLLKKVPEENSENKNQVSKFRFKLSQKKYPGTLNELLIEDLEREKVKLQEIKKRYEGWLLYYLTKDSVLEKKRIVKDLIFSCKLEKKEMLSLLNEIKTESSLEIETELIVEKDKYITIIDKPADSQNDFNVQPENNLINITEFENRLPDNLIEDELIHSYSESSETTVKNKEILPNYQSHKPADNGASLVIEEFYLADLELKHKPCSDSNYRSLPLVEKFHFCDCQKDCGNETFCCCSGFINTHLGIQKGLIIEKKAKRLTRMWKDDYFLFECSEFCKCNKLTCIQTFFIDGQDYSPRFCLDKGTSRAKEDIKRGEFVVEIWGKLGSNAFEKGIQLAEGIFMDLNQSNIKKVSEGKTGNLVPVRVFSWKENKIICRLALFAERYIKKSELVFLDYSKLDKLMENN